MKTQVKIPGDVPRLRAFKQEPGAKGRFEVKAAAGGESATLYIYGDIFDNGGDTWYGGLDVAGLVREIDRLSVDELHVHINSRGGDVFDGLALYNALARQSYRTVGHVDGVACSIASVILMGCDEIRMALGSHIMIHNAWSCGCGNASELREVADVLDKFDGSLIAIYCARSGMKEKDVAAAMAKTTWYTAAEARKAGLADAEDAAPAKPKAAGDLSVFAHAPAALRAAGKDVEAEKPNITTRREFEAFLREQGGFSRRRAEAISASGFRASPDAREEHGNEPAPVPAAEASAGAAALRDSLGSLRSFLSQRATLTPPETN